MKTALQYALGENTAQAGSSIRVMLVDDSAVARSIFARILGSRDDIEVVAQAQDAASAIDQLDDARPDIILLDIEMPERSGLDALPEILTRSKGAKVMVLSSIAVENGPAAIRALQLGACDTLAKPGRAGFGGLFSQTLIDKVVKIGKSVRAVVADIPDITLVTDDALVRPACIAIGASTGGIPAVSGIIERLDARLECPVFITQHLPDAFMAFFARQLADMTTRKVLVAEDGILVRQNHVYLAPGDCHLVCERQGEHVVVRLAEDYTASRYCPSVDAMLESIADTYGGKALAIVLSGMGNDGAQGARHLRRFGGTIIVQDPNSSVVWGMPGSVARQGIANAVLDPQQISRFLAQVALR